MPPKKPRSERGGLVASEKSVLPTPEERDEPVKIDADFEAIRALLKVDPDRKPVEDEDN
jgi:hypothetical protein